MRVPQHILEGSYPLPLPMGFETNLYIYTGLLLILFLMILFILLLILCQLKAVQLKGNASPRRWGGERTGSGNWDWEGPGTLANSGSIWAATLTLSLSLHSRSGATDSTCEVELLSYKDYKHQLHLLCTGFFFFFCKSNDMPEDYHGTAHFEVHLTLYICADKNSILDNNV